MSKPLYYTHAKLYIFSNIIYTPRTDQTSNIYRVERKNDLKQSNNLVSHLLCTLKDVTKSACARSLIIIEFAIQT